MDKTKTRPAGIAVLLIALLLIGFWTISSPQVRSEAGAPPALSGEAQIYELAWDGAVDETGRLTPGALAPRSAWQPLLWGYPEAEAELALDNQSVLLWTGEALEAWRFTGDEWALMAVEVLSKNEITTTAAISDTGEVADQPSYELFLNAKTAVALGQNAPDLCLSDNQFFACDAGEKLVEAVQLVETGDGRWLYAQQGTIYDVGWTQAQALADEALSIWTDLAVESSGPYTLTVRTVKGVILAVSGQGSALYPLGVDEAVNVLYEGAAPARVSLYRQEKRLPIADVASAADQQLRVIWEQPEGIFVPAGSELGSEAINLEIDGAMKATRVCTQWGNADTLTLTYYDANSKQPLGQAILSANRPCNIVLGKVNRPFFIKVNGSDVWVFRLETQVSY